MRNNQFSKYRSLGLNIAYYRKDRGLSQSELAERVNISRTHMSRIETADCAVSLDVVFDICDALEIKPVELFRFSGMKNRRERKRLRRFLTARAEQSPPYKTVSNPSVEEGLCSSPFLSVSEKSFHSGNVGSRSPAGQMQSLPFRARAGCACSFL